MDDRVSRAWAVISEELEECDSFYLRNRYERLGDHFRAWTLLESAWRDGISIDDLIEVVDLDQIDLADDGERVLWLADLLGTYGACFLVTISHHCYVRWCSGSLRSRSTRNPTSGPAWTTHAPICSARNRDSARPLTPRS